MLQDCIWVRPVQGRNLIFSEHRFVPFHPTYHVLAIVFMRAGAQVNRKFRLKVYMYTVPVSGDSLPLRHYLVTDWLGLMPTAEGWTSQEFFIEASTNTTY